MKKIFLSLFFFAGMYTISFAKIRLPAIIGDSMVLQRSTAVPIWGWASPGEGISVRGSWTGGSMSKTITGQDGKWMVRILTPGVGGPYDLTIDGGSATDSSETIVLHGVMTGEVWVCSGQSNMEMPVRGWGESTPIKDSKKEIAEANYPGIRFFTVPEKISYTPQEDVVGKWSVCTPVSVAPFSATAYFFGRELHRKLKVPVGLISTSWGGTVAESWTSAGALGAMGDFDKALRRIDSVSRDSGHLLEEDKRKDAIWKAAWASANNEGSAAAFNDADWKIMKLPTAWENAGYPGLDGIVWFRKPVDLPESWAGKKLILSLGPIDDYDITWFNGAPVGSMTKDGSWNVDRRYEVPGELVKGGKNMIAVRVTDLQGNGGIYGDKTLLKLFLADGSPDQAISLTGDWKFDVRVIKLETTLANNPNTVTVLYNGMIAPLVPFGIRGAIWYQGEANVGRAAQYERLFPVMIGDWRRRWKEGDFPFYFVQIAPFKYGGDSTQAAALRDAQRKTLDLVHTGMAVTLDIGDINNIHPADKEEVGRRLARWALADTYGKKEIVSSGPLYKSIQVAGAVAEISFTHTEGGLTTHGQELSGFEIAGGDGRFVPATAVIKGDKVLVQEESVAHPVAVRYAWSATAEACLFNGAGLPASSFSSSKP